MKNLNFNGAPIGTTNHTQQLQAIDGRTDIILPAGPDFLRADFTRTGPDLLIETPSGSHYLVPAFFMSETPPALHTHDGAVLSADMLTALAGPVAPGMVAQLGLGAATAQQGIGLGQPIGQVSEAEGEVTVTHPDGNQETLTTGGQIFQGDVLQTGAASNVSVVFIDDTVFSLDEDGRMIMDEMVYDPDTQSGTFNAQVVQGVFSFVSGQVAKTSPDGMMVHTPTATIGIRGSTVLGNAAAEGVENKITLIPDVDGNIGEIIINTGSGSLVLNSAGATTTVSSANGVPSPVMILSQAAIQKSFGASLNKLVKAVAQKAEADAGRAQAQAQAKDAEAKQAESEAQQANEEAQQADEAAQQADAEAAQAQADADAALAEAEAAKAQAEASGDPEAIAKAAAAEAKAAESVAKAAEAKAQAEAQAADAAKAQAEAQAKTAEAETKAADAQAAAAQAEQAQQYNALAKSAEASQSKAFDDAQKAEAEAEATATAQTAETANTADTSSTTDGTGDAGTDGTSQADAAAEAAALAAAEAAVEAALAAAEAAAAEAAALAAAADAAAKAAADAAAKALADAATTEDTPTTDTTTTDTTTTTTSYNYSALSSAITVTISGTSGTVSGGTSATLSNIKSLTGTDQADTYTLTGVTLDTLKVGAGADVVTVDATTRITNLFNRPAAENTYQTLGNDGTDGDMDLRGTTVSGEFYIQLNTNGSTSGTSVLTLDSTTTFDTGTYSIQINGSKDNATSIVSNDGMNIANVNLSNITDIVLDSGNDTVGVTLIIGTSGLNTGAITGSGDDKIVLNDSGTYTFTGTTVTGIANITFNGAGTNSLALNQADLVNVTTIIGNTGSDTITTAETSLDLSAITMSSIDSITTTNAMGTTITGTSGNDIIVGGSGNDILIGGNGADTLTGGSGADIFVYKTLTNEGIDTIADHMVSQGDRIQIEKTLVGNGDTVIDANEWFNLGSLADDAAIQAAIDGQAHVAGALFATFNISTGKAEAWFDSTDQASTGGEVKVAYVSGAFGITDAASMGVELVDTTSIMPGGNVMVG